MIFWLFVKNWDKIQDMAKINFCVLYQPFPPLRGGKGCVFRRRLRAERAQGCRPEPVYSNFYYRTYLLCLKEKRRLPLSPDIAAAGAADRSTENVSPSMQTAAIHIATRCPESRYSARAGKGNIRPRTENTKAAMKNNRST